MSRCCVRPSCSHSNRTRPPRALAGSIVAGIAAWGVIFGWRPANFWLLMGAGAAALGAFALRVRWASFRAEGIKAADFGAGVAAAAVLYAALFGGRLLVARLVPGAAAQISGIYALRDQAPAWIIAPLLACVIAPGEELFWRGLVQWDLMGRRGAIPGWVLATLVYGAAHVAAKNPMLVAAALAAGGWWGWLYLRVGRLAPVIVSHIVFDLVVFFILPLG